MCVCTAPWTINEPMAWLLAHLWSCAPWTQWQLARPWKNIFFFPPYKNNPCELAGFTSGHVESPCRWQARWWWCSGTKSLICSKAARLEHELCMAVLILQFRSGWLGNVFYAHVSRHGGGGEEESAHGGRQSELKKKEEIWHPASAESAALYYSLKTEEEEVAGGRMRMKYEKWKAEMQSELCK